MLPRHCYKDTRHKDNAEVIAQGLGRNLLANNSEEANELKAFLNAIYHAKHGTDIETARDFGHVFMVMTLYGAENPDADIAKQFNTLNDAVDAEHPHPKNTNSGITKALMRAAQDGDLINLKALFAQGVHVNAKDEQGWTALMIAARRGDTAMVEALLGHGADVNTRNQDGATALWYAAGGDHTATVEALL
jgi:hypothetical protein